MPSTIEAPTIPDEDRLVPMQAPVPDHGFDDDDLLRFARQVIGRRLPDRITHDEVIRVARRVWNLAWVCRFFTMQIEDAAVRVNGECADDYPLPVGLAIVKDFSARWNGCPEQACSS